MNSEMLRLSKRIENGKIRIDALESGKVSGGSGAGDGNIAVFDGSDGKRVRDGAINQGAIWHSGNDGPGSGLDADTVDGLHAGYNVWGTGFIPAVGGNNGPMEIGQHIDFHWPGSTSDYDVRLEAGLDGRLYRNGYMMWDAYNQGIGSGLDADKVDGKHASEFAPSGFGLGTDCIWIFGDIHSDRKTGMYMGYGLANAPTADWWYYLVLRHNALWCVIVAFPLNSGPLKPLWKTKRNNGWTGWADYSTAQ